MNAIFVSDIHGCLNGITKVLEYFDANNFDRLFILGDILYHGPRNDIPEDYAPKEVFELLNERAAVITAIRGNCDAEVDQMVLDFPIMAPYSQIELEGHQFFLTHGHHEIMKQDSLLKLSTSIIFASGHTHVKRLDTLEAPTGSTITLLNPGSPSMPKDGTPSFALYSNDKLSLLNLEGEILSSLSL